MVIQIGLGFIVKLLTGFYFFKTFFHNTKTNIIRIKIGIPIKIIESGSTSIK